MLEAAKSDSIMIIGLENIAAALGGSSNMLRPRYLRRRDFPARQEGEGGPWITTRRSLAAWADSYVNSPDRPAPVNF